MEHLFFLLPDLLVIAKSFFKIWLDFPQESRIRLVPQKQSCRGILGKDTFVAEGYAAHRIPLLN